MMHNIAKLKGWFITCSIGLFFGIMIQLIFQLCFVSGESMMPTLKNGEVFVSLRTNWTDINRGDIVVIDSKNMNYVSSDMLVKRVVAIPGDEIEIKDGIVKINHKILKEPYIKKEENKIVNITIKETLKKDEFFVLGDNRNNSTDSRGLSRKVCK